MKSALQRRLAPLECTYVYPGQVFAAERPTEATTLLGTCVAICLWDAKAGVGGMTHYLLPHCAAGNTASSRFGNVAFDELRAKVSTLGARLTRLQAKIFGGQTPGAGGREDLGVDNVEVGLRLLAEAGIRVVGQDVGGERPRKLIFHTHDGSAWVRHI